MHHLVVELQVGHLSVLAELLAVVGGDPQHEPLARHDLEQPGDQLLDLVVERADLLLVAQPVMLGAVRGRNGSRRR